MGINSNQLNLTERWSLTADVVTPAFANLNKGNLCGKILARAGGVIVTPISSAIDIIGHVALAALKFLTGLVVGPVNFIARLIKGKSCWPESLEWTSALVNLSRAVDHVKLAVFLPVMELFDPEKADALAGKYRYPQPDNFDSDSTFEEEGRYQQAPVSEGYSNFSLRSSQQSEQPHEDPDEMVQAQPERTYEKLRGGPPPSYDPPKDGSDLDARLGIKNETYHKLLDT